MDNDPIIVHRTVASRAETENLNPYAQVWEFNCPHCSYRATYERLGSRLSQLIVWDAGEDPQVRHHNSYATEVKEETWLTPELRQHMEFLLEDVNVE